MSAKKSSLIDTARRWAAADPDPETARALTALCDAGDVAELRELMGGELEFGTAGLRAVVGPGSLRMNVAVIRRTTRAVAEHLLAERRDEPPLVVVGCDARNSSPRFLEETVQVLVAAGIPVRYFEEPVATPIAAYASRQLRARAAIVITASHNPPEYNGYKLYAENGAQIIAPTDAEVAARIARMPPASEIPIARDAMKGNPLAEPVPASVVDGYFLGIDALRPAGQPARDLPIVYSAMHGVGYAPIRRAFERAGFTRLIPVEEQAQPDGNFPTVRFPNPEEDGALDLSLALADRVGAELILANDPDVDRLAACVRDGSGGWMQLTGNQIGLLLADFVLPRVSASPRPLTVSSIVSSPMLGSIAAAYDARFEQTLTGFKWVWNAALDLERDEGLRFAFGYEEALGYSAGDLVRDKDGICAAVLFAELTALLEAEGSSVRQRLEELYRQHGLWVSVQRSEVRQGSEGARQLAQAIDAIGAAPPQELGGRTVTRFVDYRTGGESRPRWLHDTPLLELRLGDDGRVLLRPSGTEPKLKIYVDLRMPVEPGGDVWAAEAPALEAARAIAQEIVQRSGLG